MTSVDCERTQRRYGGERRFFLVLFWIALVTITSSLEAGAQRDGPTKFNDYDYDSDMFKDQQMLHDAMEEETSSGTQPENICDVRSTLSVYCFCDSLSLTNDASEAKCSVFNVSDQNDSIWELFKTQVGIKELQLNVQEDGRLNFLPAAVLRHLPGLTSLQVREATIDTLAAQTFVDVTHLQELRLNRNKIRHIRPFAFQGLSKTVELELSNNELVSLERGVFADLDDLRQLFLDGNNISLVEDSVFQNLKKLEELDLSGNNIAVLTGETLMGLQQLKKLSLRGNQLTIVGDHTFAHAGNLRRLDFSSNHLQVIRQQALAGLGQLSHLDLAHNQLAGLDKAAVSPIWSNLLNSSMTFSIEDNPLQCDCRLLWILRDLRMSSSSATLKTSIDQLNCAASATGSSSPTALVTMLSKLDCRPTTVAPPTTRRPSRGSTTATYVVADEPKLPLVVNDDNSASLQLSSPAESKEVRPQVPAASAATDTVQEDQSSSSAPVAARPVAGLCLSLVFVATVLLW